MVNAAEFAAKIVELCNDAAKARRLAWPAGRAVLAFRQELDLIVTDRPLS